MDENTQNTVGDNQNSNNTQLQDFDINSFIGVGDEFVQGIQPEPEKEEDSIPPAVVQTPSTDTEVKTEPEVTTTPVQTETPVQQTTQVDTPPVQQTPSVMPAPVIEQSEPAVITPLQTGSGFAPNPDELNEILNSSDSAFSQPFNQTATDQMPSQTPSVEIETQPVVDTPVVETVVQPEVQSQPFGMELPPTEEVSSMGIDMPMEGESITTEQPVVSNDLDSLMPQSQASPVQENSMDMDIPPVVEQTQADAMPSDLSQPFPSVMEAPINNMELIPPTPAQPDEIVNSFGEEKSGKGGTAVVIVLIFVIVALLGTIGYFALQIFG